MLEQSQAHHRKSGAPRRTNRDPIRMATAIAGSKDEMVLDTALSGRVDALVTFNRADFDKAAHRFGLPLWRPQDLLARLGDAS